MIAYIETALDNLSNTGQTAGQYSSLKNIKTSAQDEIEDIDDDIDDLEDDIDEVCDDCTELRVKGQPSISRIEYIMFASCNL